MTIRVFHMPVRLFLAAVVLLAISAAQALAGGYWISIHTIQKPNRSGADETVLVVQSLGCNQPQNANVTAEAVGLVNGQRQSIPLKLDRVSDGVYQIARQWPSEGAWVLTITGQNGGMTCSALVKLGASGSIPAIKKGADGENLVRTARQKFSAAEIDNALRQASVGATGPAAGLMWKSAATGAGVLGLFITGAVIRRKTNLT
jgi:hypothetical protein